uniref:Transposase n=1 Tax=Knipowitschia caucasica TaxID=637954 RepID=A0AAV2MN03_KNICA
MRADSPGHSAKYGSYTMMNLQSNSVIDIQLIQSSEVGNSVRMEKEGFIRSLTMLEEKGVKVQAIVTDRHTGVQKYLREEKKDITHYFDPWHMGKGMGKKIDGLAKKKITQDVGQWRKSVVNHLYCHWLGKEQGSGSSQAQQHAKD